MEIGESLLLDTCGLQVMRLAVAIVQTGMNCRPLPSRDHKNPHVYRISPSFTSQSSPTPPNMSKKNAVPDAWEDDWESQADKADAVAAPAKAEEPVKISKAERLAQHAETNKKIWESAYVLSHVQA